MSEIKKYIMLTGKRKISAFSMSLFFLCLVVMFLHVGNTYAQVVSNNGAAVTVTNGTVVNTGGLDNSAGDLSNEGIMNLSGNYFNGLPATTHGNGYYTIKGDWTDLGTFNPDTSTVTFNGTVDQALTHTSNEEKFYLLNITNPGHFVTHDGISVLRKLHVLNNLNIYSGTLSLGSSSSELIVDRNATIIGALKYNDVTTQTASINDTLQGSGTIDMSGGNLSHLLNLTGASNSIGTFITSPASSSTVDYNGVNQKVFPALNYRNLTISNSGIKTLQGNSIVGRNLNIKAGTFDLGNTATLLNIIDSSTIAGTLLFNGTTTKTVSMGGELSGTGAIDMSSENRSHLLNLEGQTNTIGSFTSGTGSTVDYIRTLGSGDQTVFISDNYWNLRISGSGNKILNSNITAGGVLTMLNGNINSNGNILKLTNPAINAIDWADGTVIGKLQRAIAVTGSHYLYPVGSLASHNPLRIKFRNLSAGPLIAQFMPDTIGNVGLPLEDYDGSELFRSLTSGYWRLSAGPGMASSDYDVKLNYNGFSGVDSSARIVMRTDNGSLELDGKDGYLDDFEIGRDTLEKGISNNTTDFGIAKGRPKIRVHPAPIDRCEGSPAYFEVKSSRLGHITYQWQVNDGSGWTNITNVGIYSGATARVLNISAVDTTMNGYLYRVIVSDKHGNSNISNPALLTVNKIPIATATPWAQDVCPGADITSIVLRTSNYVWGTTFEWTRDNPDSIITSLPLSGSGMVIGDSIAASFINTDDHPITVTFTIIPTGPFTTFCVGDAITATVTINPTPRIYPVPQATIQCDSSTTAILLQSPSVFTYGDVSFKYTVVTTGDVTGFTTPVSGLPNNHVITDFLVNHTTSYKIVEYSLVPVSGFGCADGPGKNFTVTVNPTPRINASLNGDTVICDTTTINFSFTKGNPDIIGDRYYSLETSHSGNPGDVSGVQADAYYPISAGITNLLINNTKHLQTVTYRIKPVFKNVGGIEPDCERGIDTTITIYLNPTAVFDSVIVSDTVICNESVVSFTFYNTQNTTGNVVYELVGTYSLADLSGVKPDGQYLPDPYTDALTNNSEFIQAVTYLFKPVINDPVHGLYCNKGINTTRVVKVNPTLLSGTNPFAYVGGRNIRCFGESNGRIDITPKGGYYLNPYTFTWTRGADTISRLEDPDSLMIGLYRYKVEDDIGCSFTDTLTLNQPHILFAIPDSVNAESCGGKKDGEVFITVDGGSTPYRFKWDDDDRLVSTYNEDLTGARYGYQYLTIRDTNDCRFSDIYEIALPKQMTISFDTSKYGNYNISCNGATDGWIKTYASANGSPANYQYLWVNDLGTEVTDSAILTGLTAANYYLTVLDSLGCQGDKKIKLREPAPIKINRTGSKYPGDFDISCFDRSDGIINLNVTGGHTSYLPVTYNWTMTESTGFSKNTRDINGLPVGTYNIKILDTYACKQETSFALIEPPEIVIDTAAISNRNGYQVSCFKLSDAFLDLTISGGDDRFEGYRYSWSTINGQVTDTFSLDQLNIPAGNYHLDVLDGIDCPAQWDFEITQPDTISVSPDFHLKNGFEISCFEGADGKIDLNTSGGVSPYLWTWNTSDGSGLSALAENQDSLTIGTYSVSIMDQNNCNPGWTFTLQQPEKLATSIVPATVTCFGTNDGLADLTVTGGVKNYSYLWNNGITNEDVDTLYRGKYFVDIRDANNCTISDTTDILEPEEILFSLTVPRRYNERMISCFGESDSKVSINGEAVGGVGAYSYKWSPNGESDTVISNVPAGLYSLTITDENICSKTESIQVEQPFKINTEVYETDPTCSGKTDGQITLIVRGGTPEYSIVWSDGQRGQTADSIGIGRYDVMITDLNNCRDSTFGRLNEPKPISLNKPLDGFVHPDCPDIFNGKISYEINGGTQPYNLILYKLRIASDSTVLGEGSEKIVSDLEQGKYRLKITDNNQCIYSDTSELIGRSPICITSPNAFSPNGDGINDTWIIDQIEIYPNAKIEVYNRWGELIFYAPKGYTKPWNGTYKGRELPIDSYYYVIDLNNGRDVLSGNITIIR